MILQIRLSSQTGMLAKYPFTLHVQSEEADICLISMDWEEGETEGRVLFLIQHVGDTDVVSDEGGNDTENATSLGR